MKRLILLFSIFALISCNQSDPKEQLKNLNGYWQIDKVEVKNDSVVEYNLSQYVDYIKMEDSIGIRKKMQPKMDGSFIEVSKDAEDITARIENGELILYYSTPYDKWEERVLEATEDKLVVINRDKKKYYYQKYEPLLSQDEEATQE